MKILKSMVILVSFLMITNSTNAQSLILRGGLNLSKVKLSDNETSAKLGEEFKPGINLGAIVEFPIRNFISFETGLLLSTKGFKTKTTSESNGSIFETESDRSFLYLDIPLAAKATFELGNTKIYGSFGPYLGVGLAGNITGITKRNGLTIEHINEVIKWGSNSEESTLLRLDYGLNFSAGVEFKSIQIGVTYGLGLKNILPENTLDLNLRNRVISVSVGYRLFSK